MDYVLFILFLIGHLFMAFGLYYMAKKQELKFSWIAFIPIVNFYIVGHFLSFFKNKIISGLLIMLVAIILNIIVGFELFPNNYFLVMFLTNVVLAIIYYFLFIKFSVKKSNAVIIALIGIIIALVPSLFIFSIRNNEYREELKSIEGIT